MTKNDEYVSVSLDLPLEVIAIHAIEAHKRNLKLEEWINLYLKEVISQYEDLEIDLEFSASKVELTKKAIYNLEKISESD